MAGENAITGSSRGFLSAELEEWSIPLIRRSMNLNARLPLLGISGNHESAGIHSKHSHLTDIDHDLVTKRALVIQLGTTLFITLPLALCALREKIGIGSCQLSISREYGSGRQALNQQHAARTL
jgi:DNA repair exonuclease SbcCD nuclease subunit